MAVQLVVTVLALASLTSASGPECNNMVKPLVMKDRAQIFGKWVLHVSAWDKPEMKNNLAMVKNSWIELTPTSDNEQMTMDWADRLEDGRCMQGVENFTISGITTNVNFTINNNTTYHYGEYFETCSDCLLSSYTETFSNGETKGRMLLLWTRIGKLEESQLEIFKKQAACLNFLPEYHITDTGTDMCNATLPHCMEVVKPLVLEHRDQTHGKWVLRVSTWDRPALKDDLVTVKSSWIELTPTSDGGQMNMYYADRLEDGKCVQGGQNYKISGITNINYSMNLNTNDISGNYFESCSDCLLSTYTHMLPNGHTKGRFLLLFTRTGKLDDSQLEIFKKQAACLNFLPEYHFTGTDLCDDERETATVPH